MGFLYTAYLRGWIGICITDTLGWNARRDSARTLAYDPSFVVLRIDGADGLGSFEV